MLLGYDPVGGVGVINVEALLEAVLDRKRKFINAGFPSTALAIDSAPSGSSIHVLQNNAVENLSMGQ